MGTPGATHSVQALWRRHKYSVLARDEHAYRDAGRAVARGEIGLDELRQRLEAWLSKPPSSGGLRNAIEHMWGHVAGRARVRRSDVGDDPYALLQAVGREAARQGNDYLLEQTALTELFEWHDD